MIATFHIEKIISKTTKNGKHKTPTIQRYEHYPSNTNKESSITNKNFKRFEGRLIKKNELE